jgi:hypothetical protein
MTMPQKAERETSTRIEIPRPLLRERRYIYNGERRTPMPGYAIRPNRPAVRRKFSTFNLILALFATGIAIVLYVNNIIVVNQLTYDVSQYRAKYDSLMNTNAALRADLSRKSALERIGGVASQELKLKHPAEQPTLFEVDHKMVEQLSSKRNGR